MTKCLNFFNAYVVKKGSGKTPEFDLTNSFNTSFT